jgi:uncharacterized protein
MINWKRSGSDVTTGPRRHSWAEMSADLPVDVLPCSNEEYFPPPPSREQVAIMRLANAETERLRRKFNMSRREFVRTAAATAIGFWAIDAVRPGIWGSYGFAGASTDACDLEYDRGRGLATLRNLPGEFIFDVQSHHVDPDGMWRVTNPAIHAFFAAVWPQANPAFGQSGGELDPIANLSRFHYLKELFLDSATTMTVLSCVPTSPDSNNPLPLAEAAETVHLVNHLARSHRSVMHAFVMPNRGAPRGDNVPYSPPPYLDDELQLMMERAHKYRHILRGWKTYCAWGSVPGASGWWLDSDTGMAFLEQVRNVSRKVPTVPSVVATHKGFALPGFDQEKSTPRDIGPAARQNRGVNFLVYHSGYDIGDRQRPYRGDAQARSNTNTVDALIKSLRENRYDARRFRKPGHRFGNVPNVYAELGSVWRSVMSDPDQAAHLLGKLITHVGPKRVVWGTDSLWYGSPQPELVAMRRFRFTERAKELYRLPFGLEGDVEDPTRKAPRPERTIRNGILGRNAARAYRVNPDERRHKIDCDAVNSLREGGYLRGAPGSEWESAPLASHVAPGPRTRREVLRSLRENPWSP